MEKWLKRLMAWLMSWAGEWLVRMAGGAARPPVQVAAGFQTPNRIFAPDMRARGMGLTIGRKLRGAFQSVGRDLRGNEGARSATRGVKIADLRPVPGEWRSRLTGNLPQSASPGAGTV